MNEFLADLYGTREAIGASNTADVEKLAEAQVLDQVFKSEGIDVDKLPDEAIVKVAHELFGDNSAIVKAASAEAPNAAHEATETAEEEAKEEAAKAEAEKKAAAVEEEKTAADLQKADFLGRVMAHSFTQERNLIEKGAAAGKAGLLARLGSGAKKGVETAGKFVKKHPKSVAGGAAGAGAAAGFAAGRASKGEKTASAVDLLAEKRANEILAANGIAGDDDAQKLAEAVEKRALELLAEKGYTVE